MLIELSQQEMMQTEGGLIPLLIIGAIAILASSCEDETKEKTYEVNVNCTNCDVNIKGDTIQITRKQ